MKKLSILDLSILFGAEESELNECAKDLLESNDLLYSELDTDENEKVILNIIKSIFETKIMVAGEHRKQDWIDGWKENYNEFIQTHSENALIPKYYYKDSSYARLNSKIITTKSHMFVHQITNIFRTWIFSKYLSQYDNIYEFGCGTGHNLVEFSKKYPEKKYFGLDWSHTSQDILDEIRKIKGIDIAGSKFDFFNPDKKFLLLENSAIYTFGALEQTGSNFNSFIEYLIEQKPEICINIECLDTLYDKDNLYEYLAYKYHKKRNYLDSYLEKLREYEDKGKIEIIKIHHMKFGNIYNDTHSYVIWKIK